MSFLCKLVLLILLFSVSVHLNAENTPDDNVSQIQKELFDAQHALTNTKIDALKDRLMQGDQNLRVRLDAQDRLLSQQNNRISDINMFLAGFGALAAGFALFGFYSVKLKAREDAQAAAQEWFDKHQERLDEQTVAFQSKIDELSGQFSEHLTKEQEKVSQRTEAHNEKLQEVLKKLQNDAVARQGNVLNEAENNLLSEASKATQDKPENSYTFDDWNTKAFAAGQRKNYQEALLYWRKALEINGISDIQAARTLFNISLILNKLNDPEAAIVVYDDLLNRYGGFDQPVLQEQCAKALFNKGVTLGRLEKLLAAINCFEDLLTRYAQNEKPEIQQRCQYARASLAELLLVTGEPEAALTHINQLLEQIDKSSEDFTIMHFLRWIADPDTPQENILSSIRELPDDVEFTWNWDDIRPLINQLPEPRKTQANHYIAFFEDHHDIERLESELESLTPQ